jgi:hypothetical protein
MCTEETSSVWLEANTMSRERLSECRRCRVAQMLDRPVSLILEVCSRHCRRWRAVVGHK